MNWMRGELEWDRDGADWPNRPHSRFVRAGGLRWHVQVMGTGPVLLLVHGTGASTHSWAGLAPLLAERFTVVAPDLPGHGFTDRPLPSRMTLPGMAWLVEELLGALELAPALAVGHSAGAAILVQMCLDGRAPPQALLSLNGALLPFRGVAGQVFPPLAKLIFLNPFTPRVFAWSAHDRSRVAQLIRGTGSAIDAGGIDRYARLFRTSGHVAGALAMMANWDLDTFSQNLSQLETPLALVVGAEDRAVPPSDALEVHARVQDATMQSLPGVGHLAHEERPALIADVVIRWAIDRGVLPADALGEGRAA